MRGLGFGALAIGAAGLIVGTPARSAGDPRPGMRLAVAIDTSGSLRPPDLAGAGTLAARVMAALPAGSEVALFTFDDEARLVLPATASAGELQAALAALRRQGRRTALNDALYDAARYLRDAGVERRALVLITDGRDEDSAVEVGDGLAVAQQAGIPVFTVGVGRVEERVLRRIAKLTGGQYAPLRSASPVQIAGRIAALPAPSPSAPGARRGSDGGAQPAAAAAVETAEAGRGWRLFGWALAAGLVVAALVWWRRRRENEAGDEPTEAPSPTLVERMNRTEEYLEKTVTLRERPVLTITRGPGLGQVFELGGRSATSIGRAKANEVVVEDVSVSSEHCRIRPEEGRLVLHDLRSTNGTFVNERRVSRHVLMEGDVLKIGETSLLFRTDLKRA
jgi:hypothetical protein